MVEMIYDGGDHSSDFADGAMNSSCAVDDSTVPPKPPPNNPLSHQFQPPIMSTSVIVSMNRNGGVSTLPSRRSKTRSTISSLRQRSASLRRRDDEKYREVVRMHFTFFRIHQRKRSGKVKLSGKEEP